MTETFLQKLLSSPTDVILAGFLLLGVVAIIYGIKAFIKWGNATNYGLKYRQPMIPLENGTKKQLLEMLKSALDAQSLNLEQNHFEHLIEKLELAIVKSHEEQNKYLVEQLNKWGSTMHAEMTQFLYSMGVALKKKK